MVNAGIMDYGFQHNTKLTQLVRMENQIVVQSNQNGKERSCLGFPCLKIQSLLRSSEIVQLDIWAIS